MLILAYTLAVGAMLALPLIAAVGLRRVAPTPWLLFSLGCLTFFLSQVLHIPLNNWLTDLGWLPSDANSTLPLWRTALTLGLTAGLCEELLRAVGYAVLQRFKPGWLRMPDGVMLGLGHGGIEAMFVGVFTAASVSALVPMLGMDTTTLGLNPEQLIALQRQLTGLSATPLWAALPVLERLIALTAHVTFSLMVWRAFAHQRLGRDWFYILLAILYHALLDAVVVIAAQQWADNPLVIELVLIAILIPGWVWAVWVIREHGERRAAVVPNTVGGLDDSVRGQLHVFGVALVKEMRQLWRTNRLLVVGIVFLIFGLGSPLLAKLTPELLRSIEGAEMLVDLFPTPTAADAMAQYLKNLTQFGFILAVLLGMGTVVGEKERGVAPMILSKPLPRWAFLLSKFVAQVGLYLGAFALAGTGAYYYTVMLFGSLALDQFVLLNALLGLWLLTFVALSILGSTLGSSTVASGGIGLGLCVGLMLAGNLPQYGALFPSGLVIWATQVGQAAAGIEVVGMAANGGAATSAVMVIVLALVLALGVFEQQEL